MSHAHQASPSPSGIAQCRGRTCRAKLSVVSIATSLGRFRTESIGISATLFENIDFGRFRNFVGFQRADLV